MKRALDVKTGNLIICEGKICKVEEVDPETGKYIDRVQDQKE